MRERERTLLTSLIRDGAATADRVVVVSNERLVRDTVCAALHSVGFAATGFPIPRGLVQIHAARRWMMRVRPATGLLATDIDDAPHLRDAAAVVNVFDLDWLLLTSTPKGEAWGALMEAGVRDVLGAATNVNQLGRALRRLAAGRSPISGKEHEEAMRAWKEAPEEHRSLARRVEALSPREMEILIELHGGDSPRTIAERAGVAEGTVRSQVKSVLHKLEVTSQLQAVASYRQFNEWIVD